MKLFKFALKSAILVVSALSFQVASACSFDAWAFQSGTGSVHANDPNNAEGPNLGAVSRVSGFCGMEAFGTGHVEDKSPLDDASFIGRFYFFPSLTLEVGAPTGAPAGVAKIFVAYSDDEATSELFSIYFDGTNFVLDAGGATGTTSTVAATPGIWNLLEFEWVSGTTGNFWVNRDATSEEPNGTFTPGTGSVDAVRLGFPEGQGTLNGAGEFDDYQSQRTQKIGPLVICDANGDGSVTFNDILDVIVEVGTFAPNIVLQPGTPDCNLDGNVSFNDILDTITAAAP